MSTPFGNEKKTQIIPVLNITHLQEIFSIYTDEYVAIAYCIQALSKINSCCKKSLMIKLEKAKILINL